MPAEVAEPIALPEAIGLPNCQLKCIEVPSTVLGLINPFNGARVSEQSLNPLCVLYITLSVFNVI